MGKTAHEIVTSERFNALVRKRWTVSVVLTILLFASYYGYILVIAYGKEFLGQKVGEYTNWGIILGVLAIVFAWILTAIYVVWANNVYDKEVDSIKQTML
jgi:uncharacterized membrane protein (DUF485 family)